MENVYAQVEHFYQANPSSEQILAQGEAEKYLRRRAWRGDSDEELKKVWSVIAILVTYTDQMNLYSLASLTAYDYQEIFYRYHSEQDFFSLNESCILAFLHVAGQFLDYLMDAGKIDDIHFLLKETKESLYVQGRFFLPPRRSTDEFYSSLARMETLSDDTMQCLSDMMDSLLERIHRFFRAAKYKADLERAVFLYVGPQFDDTQNEQMGQAERERFWSGFWDYFLFDYHMIETDMIPIQVFFQQEELNGSERDILIDLMHAKFGVYSAEEYYPDGILCRDLFTDEMVEMPMPDHTLSPLEPCILFGHINTLGVVLVNRITVLPASRNLQKRMKEIVLQQYSRYRCQEPDASLHAFFSREAGLVRHTLNILAHCAQLSVLPPVHTLPVFVHQKHRPGEYAKETKLLKQYGMQFGFSCYALKLLCRFWADYMSVRPEKSFHEDSVPLFIAVLLEFAKLNGMDFEAIPGVSDFLGAEVAEARGYMMEIEELLHCVPYDPRYLTEDGFIRSLYMI